jgi:transaldolase
VAARLLRPAYKDSGGRNGFISFECTPDLADDTTATIPQATSLWQRLGQAQRDDQGPLTVH